MVCVLHFLYFVVCEVLVAMDFVGQLFLILNLFFVQPTVIFVS